MKTIFQKLIISTLLLCSYQLQAQNVSYFEELQLKPNSYYNGSDFKGGFKSGAAYFTNMHDTTFGTYWEGFSVSNTKDDSTPGYFNQYSSITGGGKNSESYGVFYIGGKIILDSQITKLPIGGMWVTNSTYGYLDMKTGSQFSKKFGGPSGNDPDYFRLVIKAWGNGGKLSDSSLTFYLADFRNSDNSKDYILKNWEWVNLSGFGPVDSFTFTMESSDTGAFGINTPRYFCLDNFNELFVGLNSLAKEISVSIFPNPVQEKLFIQCAEPIEEIQLLNMAGIEILRTKECSIPMNDFPTGVYLVQVKTRDESTTRKIIKY